MNKFVYAWRQKFLTLTVSWDRRPFELEIQKLDAVHSDDIHFNIHDNILVDFHSIWIDGRIVSSVSKFISYLKDYPINKLSTRR